MLHIFNPILRISSPLIGDLNNTLFNFNLTQKIAPRKICSQNLIVIYNVKNKAIKIIRLKPSKLLKKKKDSLSILIKMTNNSISIFIFINKRYSHLKKYSSKIFNLKIKFLSKEMPLKQESDQNINHKKKTSIN